MNSYDVKASAVKEYVFYIGEPIGTVGLWKRYDGLDEDDDIPPQYTQEYPIFQNTRGRGIWNASNADTTNVGVEEPTKAFWRAIEHITTEYGYERIDVAECEWYEVEVIQSVLDMALGTDDLPLEIGELLAYAESRRWTDD